MTPYPANFPLDSAKLFLSKLTGATVPLADLAHAAWDVQGFVQSQVFGDGPKLWTQEASQNYTDLEAKAALVDELKGCCYQFEIPGVTQAAGVNWQKWLELLWKVLPLLLPLVLNEA